MKHRKLGVILSKDSPWSDDVYLLIGLWWIVVVYNFTYNKFYLEDLRND